MRYLVWGYYGFGNLGDELMLQALRDGIRRRDPQAQLYVRCQNPPLLEGIIPFPIEALRPPRPWVIRIGRYFRDYLARVCKQIASVDVLVIGGGTLFIDKGRYNRSLVELTFFAAVARMLGKRVISLGVGVDDLRHPASKVSFYLLLRLAQGTWLREPYGYEKALASLGPSPKIHLSADLVYDLPWPAAHSTLKEPQKLGIVLADYEANYRESPGRERASLLEALASFLKGAYEELHMKPVFLVFQAGTGFQGDLFSAALIERLGWKEEASLRILSPDLKEIDSVYQSLTALIGMHYHALVLASIYEVPFIGINHERKFEAVCGRFDMPCIPLTSLRGDVLVEALKGLGRKRIDRSTVAMERTQAERNFEWLTAG